MKLVIPGGSGQIGNILARGFAGQGHEVVLLSRAPSDSRVNGVRQTLWDGKSQGEWCREIDGADVVINLAGRSVNCRYNKENQRVIKQSRVDSTRAVGEAIVACQSPPAVWLQSSTATIYAHTFGPPHDETNGVLGDNDPSAPSKWKFSVDVAKCWEAAADQFTLSDTRLVKLRSSIVLSPDRGGIFDVLLGLVRKGLGGTCGNGKQYVSWIHGADFFRVIEFILQNAQLAGVVNVASPGPVPNAEFMSVIRRAWGIPFGLPATEWMLELGGLILGTESELVLKSRRVMPRRLLEAGFEFQFTDWSEAAADLCNRRRAA